MGKAAELSIWVEAKVKDMVNAIMAEVKTKASEFIEAVDFLNFFRDTWISFCMRM